MSEGGALEWTQDLGQSGSSPSDPAEVISSAGPGRRGRPAGSLAVSTLAPPRTGCSQAVPATGGRGAEGGRAVHTPPEAPRDAENTEPLTRTLPGAGVGGAGVRPHAAPFQVPASAGRAPWPDSVPFALLKTLQPEWALLQERREWVWGTGPARSSRSPSCLCGGHSAQLPTELDPGHASHRPPSPRDPGGWRRMPCVTCHRGVGTLASVPARLQTRLFPRPGLGL